MKLQILSDLHLDFHKDKGRGFVQSLDPSGVDVLVLAGDLAEARGDEYGLRLREICAKYPHVVAVNGNHDLYFTTPERVDAMRVSFNELIPNLHWLENEVWVHQGHRFVGCVMWFCENPMAYFHELSLNDFNVIRGFKPWVYHANRRSVQFLRSQIQPGDIVVTHHLPSQRSVSARYRGSMMNSFFVCDMDDVIEAKQPKLWIHGHSHAPCDYTAGSGDMTRVVCNPLGYPREGNDFDTKLVIAV